MQDPPDLLRGSTVQQLFDGKAIVTVTRFGEFLKSLAILWFFQYSIKFLTYFGNILCFKKLSNIKQIIEPSGHTGYNGYFHTNRFSRKLLNTYDKAKAVTLLMQQECFVLLLLRIWAKMKTFLIHPSLGHWPTGKIIDLKS